MEEERITGIVIQKDQAGSELSEFTCLEQLRYRWSISYLKRNDRLDLGLHWLSGVSSLAQGSPSDTMSTQNGGVFPSVAQRLQIARGQILAQVHSRTLGVP